MYLSAAIMLLLSLFHAWYLPHQQWKGGESRSFGDVFRTYFQRPKIGIILTFILLYRLGEEMLVKMVAPFLMDGSDAGGLALSTASVGYVYGTVGVIGLVFGGILGGWLISKYGLRKCIWPMALALNLPNLA